jgi:hypothetical protein
MSEDERERQARAQEPAAPICEADRRNRQALYVLENEWGSGRIDVSALQRLLRGEPCECGCGPERMSA